MSIKSRLQRLEQAASVVDSEEADRIAHNLEIVHTIQADPVAFDAARALGYAEASPEGFRESLDWQKNVLWKDSPHVVAAIESDDPRSALLALVEQRTGVRLSDGSS